MWGDKMTVYEIPNIEHCTIQEIGNPAVMYRIITNDSWYIHLTQSEELMYKTAVALRYDYDFLTVQIVAEADLPENAEIYANVDKHITE